MEASLVRIPRHLLHVEFDDLSGLGVPQPATNALLALMADLPLVPDAQFSAQLIGPRQIALPCLAVLARHVGQGLRDHNLTLAHDRPRLHAERRKLAFLDAEAVLVATAHGDPRPAKEAVLFVVDCNAAVLDLLGIREAAGLASFVTASAGLSHLGPWRTVHLEPGG